MSTSAFGAPVLSARMREVAADFRVEEIAGFEPSGAGEHLLLTIEKTALTTSDVVQRLCRWAGIAPVGVGYAGLKDKHAVTTQRFTVHLPKKIAPDIAMLEAADLRVLDHAWHARKLPRGALAGNRFQLVLRGVQGERAAIDARLQQIVVEGMPNRFGEQRFGRRGDNVDQARRMFAGMRVGREQRSLLLSAVRSQLFNAALDARVAAGCWNRPIDGDVFMLEGSHSVFGPEPASAALVARCEAFDIHPTGPMWGRGALRTNDRALELETTALAEFEDLRAGLEAAGLNQERRSLRARVGELLWSWPDAQSLVLQFTLPAGSYATALLGQLGEVVEGRDAAGSGHPSAHAGMHEPE